MPYAVQKDLRADPPIYTCLPVCYVLPPTRTDSSNASAQRWTPFTVTAENKPDTRCRFLAAIGC